jgi:hypothetical protein
MTLFSVEQAKAITEVFATKDDLENAVAPIYKLIRGIQLVFTYAQVTRIRGVTIRPMKTNRENF